MTKNIITKLVAPVLLSVGIVFAVACGLNKNDTAVKTYGNTDITIGGYVYDMTTGAKLTGYSLYVNTANGRLSATVGADGKFTVSGIAFEADYQVICEKSGYVNFQSTQCRRYPAQYNMQITKVADQELDWRPIMLIPSAVQTPAFSINVYDLNTGVTLTNTTGYYKLVRGNVTNANITASSDPQATNTQQTSANGTSNATTLTQDATAVMGSFTNGTISVAAGALLYGYDYAVIVYGVPNYIDNVNLNTNAASGAVVGTGTTTTLTISSGYRSTTNYAVALTPFSTNATLVLLGQSNYTNGVNTVLGSDRQIVFTFNQAIDLDPDCLKANTLGTSYAVNGGTVSGNYVGGSNLIAINLAPDTDADGTTCVMSTNDTSVNTAATKSTWVTASVSANKLTITLAADSTLLATNDTDDDLSYDLNATATTGIFKMLRVRRTSDVVTNITGWTALTAVPNAWSAVVGPRSSIVVIRERGSR